MSEFVVHAGRKHQLRIHCADALSAPIVGDARYGSTRNDTHRSLLQHLKSFQQSEHEHSDSQTVRLNSQHTTTEQTKLQVESQNKCRGSAGPGVTTALQANSPPIASNLSLQLHAHTICIQKPQEAAVRAEAKPAGQMESLLKVLSWAPHVFDKMT